MNKPLSIKERAELATRSFLTPPQGDAVAAGLPVMPRPAKSGPANAILAMHTNSEVDAENRRLGEQLKAWQDALPVRRLNPKQVDSSRWANRHRDSFTSNDFAELKADIQNAGGNVQPIKVRPVAQSDRFEIVYGHRRHRACLELDIPVFAIIESLSETELFAEMDRENRLREDLRPYEQGEMYRRALDENLYPSLRRMVEVLGLSLSSVSRAVNIARLPTEVLDAFPSRLDIQFRWTEKLVEAVRTPQELGERIRQVTAERAEGTLLSPKAVFDRLTGAESDTPKKRDVLVDGSPLFAIREGIDKVTLELGKVTPRKLKAIEEFLVKTLGG